MIHSRILIKDLHDLVGKEATISGWVDVRRDQGKMVFFDLRDRSGKVQCVVLTMHAEALEAAKEIRSEWVLSVTGKVNQRPAKNAKEGDPNGDIEIEVLGIEVLSKAHEVPFEKDAEVNLDTLLDYRPFTLRSQRNRDIFAVQATILDAYRSSLRAQDFTEFQAPAIVGGDAEGGAATFKVDYYTHTANLATSPQLYKQIMAGALERVFTISKIFRAEKHSTTRHLSELTQMDFELAFIDDHRDVMAALEKTIRDVVDRMSKDHAETLKRFDVPLPRTGKGPFPVLKLRKAQEILEKEFRLKAMGERDLEPEHERKLCEWALDKHDSDFLFVSHFPVEKTSFYAYEDPEDPGYSRYFDLLFRGLEINSGGQRVHNRDTLIAGITKKGLDPQKFAFYLQAFTYGMPPHGGCSTGLERLTMKMLNLSNVREATPFPRDMNRIDTLLSGGVE